MRCLKFRVAVVLMVAIGCVETTTVSTSAAEITTVHFIDTTPGDIGQEADFLAEGFGLPVTVNSATGISDLDISVRFSPYISAPPQFTYSSFLRWTTPTDPAALRVREWVENASVDPPMAMTITDTDIAEMMPPEFQFELDGDGNATGAVILGRTLDAFPSELMETVASYRIQIAGLPADESVTFQKFGQGGIVVVPEPCSGLLLGIAIVCWPLCRRFG